MIRSAAISPKHFVAISFAAVLGLWFACAAWAQPVPLSPVPQPPPAQPNPTSAKPLPAPDGTDIFRRILMKFQPVPDFKGIDDPKDCILIMFGDTRRLAEIPGGLRRFLNHGGAAFIASDQPMGGGSKAALVEAASVYITGYEWRDTPNSRTEPKDLYKQLRYCPLMLSTDRRFMFDPAKPGRLIVATNLPSTLRFEGQQLEGISEIATLPDGTPIMTNDGREERDRMFGVAGDVGVGRILVLADHSIFINEMMKPQDNQNVEFAQNCLKYLRGEHGQRKRVLFVEDNHIWKNFVKGGPKPSSAAAQLFNKLLDEATLRKGLEKAAEKSENVVDRCDRKIEVWQEQFNEFDADDGINKKLWGFFTRNRPGGFRSVVRWGLILGTLGLLIYACYRLGIVSRYKTEPALPALTRAASRQAPTGSLLEMRLEGLLDADNIRETGRQLARDAFEAGGVAAPVPYREPAVAVKGAGWWRRSRVQRRVLELWRLAFGKQPIRLAPHALRALAAELEQLKADLKHATIQLT